MARRVVLLPLLPAALLAALAAGACRKPPLSPVPAVAAILSERLGAQGENGPVYCRRDRVCGSEVLPAFYRARDGKPAWIDDALALTDAAAFLDALRLVAGDGLEPANYHLAALESLLAETRAGRRKGPRRVRPETLADLEMLLTDSFLLCGSHLVHGQVDPETIQSEWFIQGRVEDLTAALEKGLRAGDVPGALDSLRPAHAVYAGLRQALRDLSGLAAAGGWPGFPAGPKLVPGDRDPRVGALRTILAATGDHSPSAPPLDAELFDSELERSVEAFQRRHGLEPDGVVGAGTAAALDVPAARRLDQVRANLERWRWIAPDLGESFVLVNVADFRLGVVEDGREVVSMAAVVGTAYRRTPDFSGRMSYLEINPTWTVPPKLVREDILPKVRKDPDYLKRKGFRVFSDWSAGAGEIDPGSVDWAGLDGASVPFKFRQDPGPQNSLGRIKFMFPNKFDVYLHDTPERGIFGLAQRDRSSGCIRVERPVDLAEHVLRGDPAWTRETILEAIESGETRVIHLRRPLNVHLIYWTAWLDGDGRIQFRNDIYLRDAALSRALEERASATPR
ncbi:MAG: L,D-transpeptidase family protein [Acidobacteria bacterium]|nr:L,D-transpeptidase family protein [Acidobacteriota bacterium]